MFLFEQEHEIAVPLDQKNLLTHLSQAVQDRLSEDTHPVRFVITNTEDDRYHCEVGLLAGVEESAHNQPKSIFRFVHRKVENTDSFNAVLLVPTGVGAEIGGHAGDATPVARLLASVCDNLITHPNVVNASDMNEIPNNGLYVEGSVVCRLLMGTVGLQPARANRVLVIIDAHKDETFVNAAINSVSAARGSFGLQCPRVVQLDPPIKLKGRFASSGRAAGQIEGLDNLLQLLDDYREEYDAVAVSSVIDVPPNYHMDYFLSEGAMVNPWGGVEAMLTHTVSSLYNVPSAHSPMFESKEIANLDPGVVDSRMAAEAVSMTFLQCILKGLHRSPRIVKDRDAMHHHSVITAADVSCLVIPDGCIGLPTLAALEQGIPVIAVRENRNIMRNNLLDLPWATGQLHIVENYWEAVGVMSAIKAGIAPESVRRPLKRTTVEKRVLATEGEAIAPVVTASDSDS
ncbi:DUF3326 domain-containing protein [Acidobacteria bacterium AH-259-L09]|nr:DUF3326 domain-containing protein [Acidobacteria bacterium AH-259-L09]